jgi:hypothetical protein
MWRDFADKCHGLFLLKQLRMTEAEARVLVIIIFSGPWYLFKN